MTHYRIVISGEGFFFDNYGSPEPVIGFIACRIVKAESESLAIALAKRDILMHWNQSFNADRKLGLPKLHIEAVTQGKRSGPKPKQDYLFFTSDEQRQAHLAHYCQKRPWWALWR